MVGPSAENGLPRYEMIYRCRYDGLDPFGCKWSTTRYAEIDGHERQLDPGHFVVGEMEHVIPPASTEGAAQ